METQRTERTHTKQIHNISLGVLSVLSFLFVLSATASLALVSVLSATASLALVSVHQNIKVVVMSLSTFFREKAEKTEKTEESRECK
jgi:hypothetical protein